MKKILSMVILFSIILGVLGCSSYKPIPSEPSESIYVAIQQKNKLKLNIFNKNDMKLKGSLDIKKLKEQFSPPVVISQFDKNKMLIATGVLNDKAKSEIFLYDSNEGKINKLGDISSVTNLVIAEDNLYSTRVEANANKLSFWLDVYNKNSLKKINSIKIPENPIKVKFSKPNNALYILFNNENGIAPISSIGKFDIINNKLSVRTVENESFSGDLTINNSKVFVTLQSKYNNRVKSKNAEANKADNRVIVFNENLDEIQVINTSDYPRLINVSDKYFYVTVGSEKQLIEKYSLNNGTLINSFVLPNAGMPLSVTFENNRLILLQENSIILFGDNGEERKTNFEGSSLTVWQ